MLNSESGAINFGVREYVPQEIETSGYKCSLEASWREFSPECQSSTADMHVRWMRQALQEIDSAEFPKMTGLVHCHCDFCMRLREFVYYAASFRQLKLERKHRIGWVYMMANQRNRYIKIGFSRQYPSFREQTLQSEDPDVLLLATWRGTRKDEMMLHERYAEKRLRGEWFNLSTVEMCEIVYEFCYEDLVQIEFQGTYADRIKEEELMRQEGGIYNGDS